MAVAQKVKYKCAALKKVVGARESWAEAFDTSARAVSFDTVDRTSVSVTDISERGDEDEEVEANEDIPVENT
jgi:hypothetical protein